MGTVESPVVNHPRRQFPSATVASHTATQLGLSPARSYVG